MNEANSKQGAQPSALAPPESLGAVGSAPKTVAATCRAMVDYIEGNGRMPYVKGVELDRLLVALKAWPSASPAQQPVEQAPAQPDAKQQVLAQLPETVCERMPDLMYGIFKDAEVSGCMAIGFTEKQAWMHALYTLNSLAVVASPAQHPAEQEESVSSAKLACTCHSHQFVPCRGQAGLGAGWVCANDLAQQAPAQPDAQQGDANNGRLPSDLLMTMAQANAEKREQAAAPASVPGDAEKAAVRYAENVSSWAFMNKPQKLIKSEEYKEALRLAFLSGAGGLDA